MTLYVVMFGMLYYRSSEKKRDDFVLDLQQAHLYAADERYLAYRVAKRLGGKVQELHVEFVP